MILRNYAVVMIAGIVAATGLPKKLACRVEKKKFFCVLEPVFLAGLLILVTGCIVDGSFNPFIYFRF